jgi:hypothetical protein
VRCSNISWSREQCDFVSRGSRGGFGSRGRQINKCIPGYYSSKNYSFFSLLPLLPLPISRGSHFFALLPLEQGMQGMQGEISDFSSKVMDY